MLTATVASHILQEPRAHGHGDGGVRDMVDDSSVTSVAEEHRGMAGAGSAPMGPGSCGGGGPDGVPASAAPVRWQTVTRLRLW